MTSRLPLTVIGGFLGAGKTTLLNRLLRESRGRRLAVLVNDFGALNIDAELVAADRGDMVALSNGCVCCSIGDDLSAALIRVLDAVPPFDAVLIEASGVSDPWRIAQVGLADPGLSLDGVVVLVDADALLDQAADPLLADSLQRQLRAADLVVVNKTDLVGTAERQRVLDWLDTLLPDTPRFETEQAALPAELLDGPRWPAAARAGTGTEAPAAVHDHGHAAAHADEHAPAHPSEHAPAHPHEHAGAQPHEHAAAHADEHVAHADQFETWAARPDGTLSAPALRAALRAMPRGVLRLKGLVQTDELGWSELQFAGRHGSLRRAAGAPNGGAAVVAIGLRGQLPAVALDALLARASAAR